MANQQSGNQTNQGQQANQNQQGGQNQNQGQWGMSGQGQFGGSGYGSGAGFQGGGMYDPATWGMGNPAGGPYSGPNQGYGANWYGAPQYAGYGPLGYPMGGFGGGYGYGQGQWGGQGFGMPQYAGYGGFGGLNAPVTETITEWWLIPGPATGMGPQNTQRPDQRIEEDVCDQLTAHGHLDARNINVSVKDGEVTLSGTVDSRQDKRTADQIADGVSGVKDVHNQLKVQPSQQSQQQGQQGQSQQQQGQHAGH